MVRLKENTNAEYTKFICEHLELSNVYFYLSKQCEYKINVNNKELSIWIDWWGHQDKYPKNKILFDKVEIVELNRKSFVVYYEIEKYKGKIRVYIPFHCCCEDVQNKLQNQLIEETIKNFYLDNRIDVINFEITNKLNNEENAC